MKKFISKFALSASIATVASFLTTATINAQSYRLDTSISDAAGASFAWGSIILMCCIFIVSFAIPVILGVYVYKDAQKNGVDNPLLWAIITIIFTVIGLLIYFLGIRPDAIRRKENSSSNRSQNQ